jgi:hypothetical protein
MMDREARAGFPAFFIAWVLLGLAVVFALVSHLARSNGLLGSRLKRSRLMLGKDGPE